MYSDALLTNLVIHPEPLEHLLEWLVKRLEPGISSDWSGSYEKIEEELTEFERWLDTVWGMGFYETLIGNEESYSIPLAFKTAAEMDGNVLICDGFSIRELMFLRKALPERVRYNAGKAPTPTTTENVVETVFQSTGLIEALTGQKLYWGNTWNGDVIEDISNPPRLGKKTGLMFLSYHPDAPLHRARSYGLTQVQDVGQVMKQISNLVSYLSRNSPLVITGDHGYIYVGDNPNKYLWLPYKRKKRFGADYTTNFMEVEGVRVAVGRFHASVSRRSNAVIVHGGVSLCESLVPVVVVEAEPN